MEFRRDINGLRAIAVIAVVLFHFSSSLLPGGFAGVDVFFVISGFLMTGIIFKGIERSTFSVINFYIARANRLIPALAIFCLIILVLGYFFLSPWDYKTVGRDVATSIFFVSNIMFSLKGGYFDTGDNFLLHTWSLSVEWQFYLIYPVILVALKKFFSLRALKLSVLVGTVLGFIFCVVATMKWPSASYYLLPMRAWEMMLGGVAYLYPLLIKDKNRKVIATFGLLLIFGSYLFVSEENNWPGYLALFPVLGAFLVIQAGSNGSFILDNKISQLIGRYSYSIYLWHWPVAVSFGYYHFNDKYKIFGIIISLLLGFLSYHWVEKYRFKSGFSVRLGFNYSLIFVFLSMAGYTIFKTQGISYRENLLANSLMHGGTMDDYSIREGLLFLNTDSQYDYLLIGDSNANHYVRGILFKGTKVKHSWYVTCLSFPNSISARAGAHFSWKENCSNNFKVALTEEKPIIIAQSWVKPERDSLVCTSEKCALTGDYYVDLKQELRTLFDTYGIDKDIYLIGELPKPKDTQIIRCLKSKALLRLETDCDEKAEPHDHAAKVNHILYEVRSGYERVKFIDPSHAICSDGLCSYNHNGKSIFMTDGGHLSGYGSEIIWDYIIKVIDADRSVYSIVH
jgi:peptidoglycan/LPS O-acetylase OafA/YrhL